MTDQDTILPQSLEGEQSVLGSMLIERRAVDIARAVLQPKDFYRQTHGVIFEAISMVADRDDPVDLLSVREQLVRMDVLENVGGATYLIQLTNAVPSAANIAYYVSLVEEKSILRGLIDATFQIEKAVYSEYENISQVLAKTDSVMKTALRIPSGADTVRPVGQVVSEAFEEIERRQELGGALPGISTGLFGLDYYLGGLEPQKMVVIGGRSSMGKSALGCTITRNVLRAGKRVLAFSIEVDEKSFIDRLLAIDSEVPLRSIRRGTVQNDDWRKLGESGAWLSESGLTIDARPAVTTGYIRNKVRNAKADGVEVIVVDHMHIITPEERTDNESSMWGKIARELFEIGREFDVPMLVLGQFNRESEKRGDKRPLLSDFQGSGGIEQNAFTALGVYRPSYHARKEKGEDTPERESAEIYILKQRDGATGVIHCEFMPHIVKFVDEDPNGVPMKTPTAQPVRQYKDNDDAVIQRTNPAASDHVQGFFSGVAPNGTHAPLADPYP